MFKALRKILNDCKYHLKKRDYDKVFYTLSQERIEEEYLNSGYKREFETINKLLGQFVSYITFIGSSTAVAKNYSQQKETRSQEKEQREKTIEAVDNLYKVLDQLETEIWRMVKESKKD